MEQLSIGYQYLAGFLTEAMRSLRGRILNGSGALPVSRLAAQNFFEAQSLKYGIKRSSDIIESSSLPYQKLFSSKVVQDVLVASSDASIILDYGCGSAKLLSILRANGFSGLYYGCDIDRVVIEKLQSQNEDENARFSFVDEYEGHFNLAFMSNVLVYNQEADALKLLREVRALADPLAKIVIMEPHKHWYWEFVFDGILLCPRKPDMATKLLHNSGWIVREYATVSLFLFGQQPICPIAYALIAEAGDTASTIKSFMVNPKERVYD